MCESELTYPSDKKLGELQLDTLKITEGPDYEPKKAALPETRLHILDVIREWIYGDVLHTQAFLLLGKAGVGKSAIAHRVVQEAMQLGRLGAFFCFSAGIGPENFFRTIARRLADLEPSYAAALMENMDSTLKTTPSMTRQLQDLLVKPFETLNALGPIIIVVDALDECAAQRDELIHCLHDNISLFPKNIRFIITSRPTEAESLRTCTWVYPRNLEIDESTNSDIYKFTQSRLINPIQKLLPLGFGKPQLDDIVTAAEGLFQYAAVVCREITDAEKHRKETPLDVHARLVKTGSQGLDALYLTILNSAVSVSDGSQLEGFHRVMGWILHAQERLSRQILQDFESVWSRAEISTQTASSPDSGNYGLVASILHPLGALLSGTGGGETLVFPLHSSFRNFLLEKSRSNNFCIGTASTYHVSLATICLKIMDRDLHFNMASLDNSYVFNAYVPDFDDRVKSGISPALLYACLHWAKHIQNSAVLVVDFTEIKLVYNLIENLFLFWCEVLALKKQTDEAEKSLQMIGRWSQVKLLFKLCMFIN